MHASGGASREAQSRSTQSGISSGLMALLIFIFMRRLSTKLTVIMYAFGAGSVCMGLYSSLGRSLEMPRKNEFRSFDSRWKSLAQCSLASVCRDDVESGMEKPITDFIYDHHLRGLVSLKLATLALKKSFRRRFDCLFTKFLSLLYLEILPDLNACCLTAMRSLKRWVIPDFSETIRFLLPL